MATYEYSILDDTRSDIRVIILEAGSRADPIRMQLQTLALGEDLGVPKDYEAISYAWGSGLKPDCIIIDDKHSLPITASLHDALQRFRLPGMVRRLWADAVCINQSDLSEKAVQVGLMGQVYASAAQVLVWLGESLGLDELELRQAS